VIIGLSDMGIT